jgi:hypothetical protein
MPTLEEYLRNADTLAQEVVNAWGINVQSGNASLLTDQFKVLLDKACLYRNAKNVADNRRKFSMLSEQEEVELKTARQTFAEAYKAFYEKQASASSSK